MNAVHATAASFASLGLLLAASSAVAQDALGSGNALDAGLNVRGRANQPTGQDLFGARNLLITNNVIGGRGFRGTIGYTAANDFRGALGSDDFYRFRRDSAWTDVTFLNYGNTYQQLRFGQNMGLLEYRRDFYGSSGQTLGETPQLPGEDGPTPSGRFRLHGADLINTEMQLDQVSFSSSSSMASRVAAEPIKIGYTEDEEGGQYLINASSLTGLDITPINQDFQMLGLTTYDAARVREDLMARREPRELGRPFEAKYEDLLAVRQPEDERIGGAVDPGAVDNRIDLRSEPEFQRILERVADRYAKETRGEAAEGPEEPEPGRGFYGEDETKLYEELDEDLRRIREYLAGRTGSEIGASDDQPGLSLPGAEMQEPRQPEEPQGLEDPLRGLQMPDRLTAPGRPETSDFQEATPPPLPGDDEEDQPQPLEVPLEVELDELGTILRHGERIEALTSKDQSRFDELLAGAEEKLRAGEYFWAERRFIRALRFIPGHPLATAGLAHAQLGAGLYLSSSLTLQSLFRFQPEMIDARYEEGLLPSRVRLLQARDALIGRLDEERDRVSNAFLLAYVGRLLGERPVVEQGLAAMEDAEPDNPLLKLLKTIWLAEEEPPETAGGADAEPPVDENAPRDDEPEK
ncbi:MAG: hypothetical protein SYC29_03555 [Planctomycetota bacterium]|nr:hypothetical protein [Planctomycetota bacterium]